MPFRSLRKQPRQLINEPIRQRKTLSLKMTRWKSCTKIWIACRRLSIRWRRSAKNNRNLSTHSKPVRLNHNALNLIPNYRCKRLLLISQKRIWKMKNLKAR